MKKQLTIFDVLEGKAAPPVMQPPRAPGFYAGPVSDETGGPLRGAEAARVVTGQSIRFAGHAWEKGQFTCRDCADFPLEGAGFRMTVYSGTSHDASCGPCEVCGADVVGENPRRGM